jgi:hypothetical protein
MIESPGKIRKNGAFEKLFWIRYSIVLAVKSITDHF